MGSPDQHIRQAGIAGLYIVCLGAFVSPVVLSAGTALLAFAFLLPTARNRGRGRADSVPLVTIATFFGFVVVRTLTTALGPKPSSGPDWETLADWLLLLLFVPFAAFLQADARRLGRLLLVALVSLILGMLWRLDWSLALEDPARLLTKRHGYGLTAIGFALLSGTALIGLTSLRGRWCAGREPSGSGPAKLLLWFVAFTTMVQGFVQAQSRGSWLALIAAAGTGFTLARRFRMNERPPERLQKVAFALAIAAFMAAVTINAPRFAERWRDGYQSAVDLAGGELRDVSSASFGLRWSAQRAGIDLWSERPWFGWGANSSRSLMEESGAPNVRSADGMVLKHLHNTYLEIAVQFGAVGLLLFLAMVLMLMRSVWRAVEEQRIPTDYGVFLLSAWAYSLFWGLFDYRTVHQDWRAHWILLAGASLSWTFTRRQPSTSEPQT